MLHTAEFILKTGRMNVFMHCSVYNSILCIKQGMNGFMCEAAIDQTRRRRSAGGAQIDAGIYLQNKFVIKIKVTYFRAR